MSLFKAGASAIGKLISLGILLAVFLGGMVTVVYYSLQGREIKVPEITGKSFVESETELASLGLKIKKRADRVSTEAPNTIIEQLPRPGETVKTGQMILVVTSKAPLAGEEAPVLKKTDEDDSDKIEEMITDKPKKTKTNTNTNRKKADTARDVNTSTTNSNSNSDSSDNSNKKETGTPTGGDKPKPSGSPSTSTKPNETKPKPPARPNR
ncbi:MAG TPA: PASTA domain-containing protein [Pyrinomonadaceae bacterium]|nr:PASTA domain-containing protein [Pyrinomonadaceae bacterium]